MRSKSKEIVFFVVFFFLVFSCSSEKKLALRESAFTLFEDASQCGEVSYSGKTVAKIEEIVEKLKEALTEVAIVEFAA